MCMRGALLSAMSLLCVPAHRLSRPSHGVSSTARAASQAAKITLAAEMVLVELEISRMVEHPTGGFYDDIDSPFQVPIQVLNRVTALLPQLHHRDQSEVLLFTVLESYFVIFPDATKNVQPIDKPQPVKAV
jgi:hypothetical protein